MDALVKTLKKRLISTVRENVEKGKSIVELKKDLSTTKEKVTKGCYTGCGEGVRYSSRCY
jgi:hypothetical protein